MQLLYSFSLDPHISKILWRRLCQRFFSNHSHPEFILFPCFISNSDKQNYSDEHWRRNRITHNYFGVSQFILTYVIYYHYISVGWRWRVTIWYKVYTAATSRLARWVNPQWKCQFNVPGNMIDLSLRFFISLSKAFA